MHPRVQHLRLSADVLRPAGRSGEHFAQTGGENGIIELTKEIKKHAESCKLDSWTSFVNEMDVPSDIFPALASGRPELIKLIQPRALTAVEAKVLFNIIDTLIETNTALRDHAAFVSQFVGNWADSFKALRSVGDRIVRFAAFDHSEPEEG